MAARGSRGAAVGDGKRAAGGPAEELVLVVLVGLGLVAAWRFRVQLLGAVAVALAHLQASLADALAPYAVWLAAVGFVVRVGATLGVAAPVASAAYWLRARKITLRRTAEL